MNKKQGPCSDYSVQEVNRLLLTWLSPQFFITQNSPLVLIGSDTLGFFSNHDAATQTNGLMMNFSKLSQEKLAASLSEAGEGEETDLESR